MLKGSARKLILMPIVCAFASMLCAVVGLLVFHLIGFSLSSYQIKAALFIFGMLGFLIGVGELINRFRSGRQVEKDL
jgi:hypothetical protein